jgi:hypothetical protein
MNIGNTCSMLEFKDDVYHIIYHIISYITYHIMSCHVITKRSSYLRLQLYFLFLHKCWRCWMEFAFPFVSFVCLRKHDVKHVKYKKIKNVLSSSIRAAATQQLVRRDWKITWRWLCRCGMSRLSVCRNSPAFRRFLLPPSGCINKHDAESTGVNPTRNKS